MGVAENDYKRRVANQDRWKVARWDGPPLFRHLGEAHSLNHVGMTHPLVVLVRLVPVFGARIEKHARRLVAQIDHYCARIRSSMRHSI
jgi:hypothetical protein